MKKKLAVVLKNILNDIKKEKFPEWESSMDYDLTYALMFNNVFLPENVGTEKHPKFVVKDMNGLHDINSYEKVDDFIYGLTGMEEWSDEYGYETYYVAFKEQWINDLLYELEERLDGIIETDEDIMVIFEEEQIKDMFVNFTEIFWEKWTNKNLKDIVEENYIGVLSEEQEHNIAEDMYSKEQSDKYQHFQNVAIDFLNYIGQKEMTKLKSRDTYTKNKVKEWSKGKNYEELSLFEEFYPKDKGLQNFKWLDKKVYKEKFTEKDLINESISSILKENGIEKKVNLVSEDLRKIYELREHIFNIPGEKILYINNAAQEVFVFSLDKYNRINGHSEGIYTLTNVIENLLEDAGSIIVRQFTDDQYLTTDKNNEILSKNYFNVYGVMIMNGNYRGLTKEELTEVCQIHDDDPKSVRFLDWDIGGENDLLYPDDID